MMTNLLKLQIFGLRFSIFNDELMKKVELSIPVKATPGKIIDAFTEFHMLNDWWDVERCLIQKQEGGTYTLAWKITPEGFGFVSSGQVAAYIPEKLLEITNMVYLNLERPILGPMKMTVKASVVEDGQSLLYLCQSGYQSGEDWDWYYDAVRNAWPVVARALKEYLETGQKPKY